MGTTNTDLKWQKQILVELVEDVKRQAQGSSFGDQIDGLLNDFQQLFGAYFDQYFRLKKDDTDDKIKPHKHIERFIDEWGRVFNVINSAQLSYLNIDILLPVLQIAVGDLGIEHNSVMIVPEIGRQFSTRYFSYSPHFVSFEIPLYSIKSPWEWSILWHEAAGLKLRRIKNQSTANDETKRDYFEQAFRQLNAKLRDETGFEDDVQEAWNKFWSTKHFEELIEDAVSVKTFGLSFLRLFQKILDDYAEEDRYHPPKALRLRVARNVAQHFLMSEDGDETKQLDALQFGFSDDLPSEQIEQRQEIEALIAEAIVEVLNEPFFQPLDNKLASAPTVRGIIRTAIEQFLDGDNDRDYIVDTAIGELDAVSLPSPPVREGDDVQKRKFFETLSETKTVDELYDLKFMREPDLAWFTDVSIQVVGNGTKHTVRKWWLKPHGHVDLFGAEWDTLVSVLNDPSLLDPYHIMTPKN